MSNNEVVSVLNNLIETCRNGQETYRSAAENIVNSEFRRMFNIFSQQRAQFVTELQSEVHRLGGEPVDRNGVEARHFSGDEASIIAECQREEQDAVDHYQAALNEDLPLDIQYVAKRQYMDIKDAYDRIRILQRAA
jgi:uncharacterized protein (TIGR02284 family)